MTFARLFFALFFFTLPQAQALDGPNVGGGGNARALEFSGYYLDFIGALTSSNFVGSPVISQAEWDKIYSLNEKIELQFVYRNLKLRKKSVDAINFPKTKIIEVNIPAWDRLQKNQRYALAVHEILGLAEISDTNYRRSHHLVELTLPLVKPRVEIVKEAAPCPKPKELVEILSNTTSCLKAAEIHATCIWPGGGWLESTGLVERICRLEGEKLFGSRFTELLGENSRKLCVPLRDPRPEDGSLDRFARLDCYTIVAIDTFKEMM